ncbi:MAG: hypothetical protein LBR11_08300 [Deltaproteobacteria bacterium]|jgi:hypothetical protein|nr:hypothetical protein [Deltaproteobacteria bacterium]
MPRLFLGNYQLIALLSAILVVLAGACSSGPLDPGRLAQVRDRDAYLALAKTRLAHDEIFFLNPAGESLLINALDLDPELMAAGQKRWSEDKRLAELLSQWLPAEGPPARVVLVGLYLKGLVKDDVLKNGRFRLQLKVGGQTLEPLALFEVKPEVWADYYPVFSRWDKVFAARFPGGWPSGGVLLVHWPSGHREVPLAPTPARPGNPG